MAKTKQKTRPRPAVKPRASTALAVRKKALPSTVSKPAQVLPPALEDDLDRRIGDDILIGRFGMVELKLSDQEERILSESVPDHAVMVKPTGVPYLPHAEYTRWFNRAFGRLGWALVPMAKPQKGDNTIVIPYMLHIHGQPVAAAYGAAEYHPNNREQTYDDVLESTVAYALRRCAKRIGVGLELWDRAWVETWMARNAIRVKVKPKNEGERPKTQWRRKTDPPFWNEMGRGSRDEEERGEVEPAQRKHTAAPTPPAPREPNTGTHAHQGEPISQAQRQRLVLIIRNSGREESQVSAWLKEKLGIHSLKELKRRDYDRVCSAIEASGDLPK